MHNSDRDDPMWQTAWSWVIREHEQPLNESQQTELVQWLKANPAHFQTYEEASRIWLLSGLVPASPDLD
jgi:ferric-dicitrate binding protein FerR (iron transport regulator)